MPGGSDSGASRPSTPHVGVVAAAVAGLVAGASIAAAMAVLWIRRQDGAGKAPSGHLKEPVRDQGGVEASLTAAGAGAVVTRQPAGSWHEADMTPPLPEDVVRLLQASRLCFLSTFCDDHPHLSLMNFTYYPDDEVIILSTRRDTKKYKLVQTARHVAILVHEFRDTGGEGSSSSADASAATAPPSPRSRCRKVTITLNGTASIQEGELAEKYREIHVTNNPDSKTFIVGPNIAIITVRVRTARICNTRDEVTVWDVANSSTTK